MANGTAGNDVLNGTTKNDSLKGLAGDDTLFGLEGNDSLDGGVGVDTLYGGLGNDTYVVDNPGDLVNENAGEGTDTVKSSIDYMLTANVENLTLTGAALVGAGNDLDNSILGTSGNNILDGGLGADTMNGGAGNDTYYVDNIGDKITDSKGTDTVHASISYTLQTGLENLILDGSDNLNATGNASVNVLTGNDGDNTLNGMAGADTMIGGNGNDTYIVDNAGDVVSEDAGVGVDTILTSVTHTMEANVENMTLTGTANINGFGNSGDNVIIGNSGTNSLSGGAGNDTLDGGVGADKMSGGLGDDTYYVDNASDTITEGASEGTDTVITALSHTLAANVENLILTGVADINGTGNDLNNVLTGNSGNNTLDGKAGDDHLIGGLGNDVYIVDSINDIITEDVNGGTDTVMSTVTQVLQANVENLILMGTGDIGGQGNGLNNVITGNSGNNVLDGGAGDDTLDGGAGADTLLGGTGNDTYIVDNTLDNIIEGAGEGTQDTVLSSVTYALGADIENLTLTGGADATATGNGGDNTLIGNTGNNVLDGGAGADRMEGGLGNDTYFVDNISDIVVEGANAGADTVSSSISYGLGANLENLILTGTATIGIGNELNNNIIGDGQNNTIDGGIGADVMSGGLGNDTYVVDNINDIVVERSGEGTLDVVFSTVSYTLSANVENLTLNGSSPINGTGNASDNVITGNSGDNTLDGMGGNDTLIGNGGNDTFIIDSLTDTYTGGTGTDTVVSSVVSIDLTSHAEIENATLLGSGNLDLTGNAGNNVLTGNDGDNVIDGGAGADIMAGGKGNDSYIVDNSGDVINELANGGTDTVIASADYTLGANLENLTLTGTGNINGTGNELNNDIFGTSGNNILDGGAGADGMVGGLGNDTYIVDNSGDLVVENAGEGTDTVQSSISYTLGANVENLILTGSSDLTGTGNAGNNVIIGNSGNDTLDGKGGADTLDGSAGQNNVYIVDDANDVVIGSNFYGDTIHSSVSWNMNTHTTNVENLVLTGNADINATGDGGFNNITGNAGNNVIDGGSGSDAMAGGAGNDTFMVDDAEDFVIENENEGTDTIITTAFLGTLSSNVEILKLAGGVNVGYGNELDNTLVGNTGGGIHNTLDGQGGADVMIGGTGDNDFYVDNSGDSVVANTGVDTVYSSITYSIATQSAIENITLIGADNIDATGNAGNNVIIGNSGNNVLHGGGGTDVLQGGLGDDTYYLDAGVSIVENADSGTDTVYSSISYNLGANLENLVLTVATDEYAGGNALDNTITGGAGNNYIDGMGGTDTMIGLAGNDTYIVDSADDVVIEAVGGGTADQVNTTISYTLGANVENLKLDSGNINGTGNELNNTITGSSGDNTLDGKAGADVMIGGGGNDTFIVDNAGDMFTGGTGTDLVTSSVVSIDLTSHAEIENATLTGNAALNLTGNAGVNNLTGNAGDNTLDGGAGGDVMIGGGGNDTYFVDSTFDVVIGGTGIDTVMTSVGNTVAMSGEIENITLTGTAIYAVGNGNSNLIIGNASDNVIDGGLGGTDTLVGGAGNDGYLVYNAASIVTELAGEGNDGITAINTSYAIPANVEHLELNVDNGGTYVGTGDANANDLTAYAINGSTVTLLGGAGNDTLQSYLSENSDVTLDGGTGADTMTNNAVSGTTTFVVDDIGDVVNGSATLVDTVQTNLNSYTLGTNIDNLVLTGAAISGTGNALDNQLTGNSNDNTLDGGAGADIMSGGAGNDVYYVDNAGDLVNEIAGQGTSDSVIVAATLATYTLTSEVEKLTMMSNAGVTAFGNASANIIITGNGADTIDGGAGADTMSGGLGNDTYYVDNAGDQIFEGALAGTDVVISTVSYTLAPNVEQLVLASGAGAINATGNGDSNILTGNESANTLNGAGGVDTMIGGDGDDTYIVTSTSDLITETLTGGNDTVIVNTNYTLGANLEYLTLAATAGDINGTGNELVNILTGNAGNNTLDGGIGADTMIGGAGNDTYIVDAFGDVVTELANGGTDTVLTAGSYTLGANVENLTLLGSNDYSGIGNNLVNVITGNAGNNTLDGGAGADTMIGGAGNDAYFVDNAGDKVVELAGGGTDTVFASITYTVTAGSEIENLTLIGTAKINGTGTDGDNVITGNSAANSLVGLGGNDTLDGGLGADVMVGGDGNDTYYIDNASDKITETVTGGIDVAFSSVTYTLASNVETLTLTGTDSINAFGNAEANHLIGNDGANTLDGKAGSDLMEGGDGSDTYIVDNAGDIVTETLNHGTADTVISSVDYTLTANVENLTLSGSALMATGNALDNVLTGNSKANILDGLAGADHMIGGSGNDTYYVDNAGDVIVDSSGSKDLVHASVDYTLVTGIESLILDTGAHIGTGNASANTITANDDGNTLFGLAGADKLFGGLDNDILDGGAGKDTMTGGGGSDTFVFHATEASSASNMDTITDFHAGPAVDHDVIDIHDILQGYTGGPNLSDYVHLTVSHGNTILSVDADGLANGSHFTNIATLTGVSLTDVDQLVTDHNLLVM